MATAYVINPSGVLVKPQNKAHMMRLLSTESRWVHDPETGQPKQVGGFRPATDEETKRLLAEEQRKSKEMERAEFERKKREAQVVMVAPDEAMLERLVEAREAPKEPKKGK